MTWQTVLQPSRKTGAKKHVNKVYNLREPWDASAKTIYIGVVRLSLSSSTTCKLPVMYQNHELPHAKELIMNTELMENSLISHVLRMEIETNMNQS